MAKYAAGTEVPADRSRTEIERILTRYGATQFAYGWTGKAIGIGFAVHGRQVKMTLPLPVPAEFGKTPTGRSRSAPQIDAEYEKEVRRKWRALVMVIKAKLEAVESGIVTFEDEFAMHMVLPTGQTVREVVLPAIEKAYDTGEVPPLLAIGGGS